MSHYIKALVAVWAIALAVAGSSYATSFLQAHNGDNVRAGKVLCIIRSVGVTCGRTDHPGVMASVTKEGVVLLTHNKVRYVCLNSGICAKP